MESYLKKWVASLWALKMRRMDLKKASIYKHHIATSFGICCPCYWPHGSTCNDRAIGFPAQ